MRVVLDTNVVISALLWRGTPYRLLDLTAYERITIVTPAEALRRIETQA